MSKLANQLRYEMSKPLRYSIPKMKYTLTEFEMEKIHDISLDIRKEYVLGLKIKSHFVARDQDNFDKITYTLKRNIVEEVFGEFRPIIFGMFDKLYMQDFEGLQEDLKELEYKMFHEGLGNE